MSKKKMGAFGFFDHIMAQDFGVHVEVYIEAIENAPAFRTETILSGIINDDPKKWRGYVAAICSNLRSTR